MRSPHPDIILLILLIVPEPGQPKITQLNIPILINKHIRTLQITMQYIFPMQIRHPQCHILTNIKNLLLIQFLTPLMQIIKQTATRKKFSHHNVLVIVDAHAYDM